MIELEFYKCSIEDGRPGNIAILTLNRPAVSNALHPEMMQLFIDKIKIVSEVSECRGLLIRGQGKNFCAGADIAHMKDSGSKSKSANLADAKVLAHMFESLYMLPIPTIGFVQGAAFGGALGLIAAVDFAFADPSARFALSEVKLGIIPAVIFPYLKLKMPVGLLNKYMLTGAVFSASDALAAGLVQQLVPFETFESVAKHETSALLAGGPAAQQTAKKVFRDFGGYNPVDASKKLIHVISELRSQLEAQEGLGAFIQKKPVPWLGQCELTGSFYDS